MAIEHASGTWYGYSIPGGANATGSFSITIPSDANVVAVYATEYYDSVNYLTGGSYGVTLDGNSPSAEAAADGNINYYQGAGWIFLNPPTGLRTVAWNFGAATYESNHFAWVAYKGVESIRGNASAQHGTLPSTTFTAQSGDLITVAVGQFNGSSGSLTWSNATKISDGWAARANLGIAEANPTGNVTISASLAEYDGAIMGFVLVPSNGAGKSFPPFNSSRSFQSHLVR